MFDKQALESNYNKQKISDFIEMNTDIPFGLFMTMLEHILKQTTSNAQACQNYWMEFGREYGIQMAYKFLDLEDPLEHYWLGVQAIYTSLPFGEISRSVLSSYKDECTINVECYCKYKKTCTCKFRCRFCQGFVVGALQAYTDTVPTINIGSQHGFEAESCGFRVLFRHHEMPTPANLL